jgi:hypothetical protein
MNLQEALNYRKNCIIHGSPLKPNLAGTIYKFEISENSLDLRVSNRFGYRGQKFVKSTFDAIRFSFNGTFIKTSYCPANLSTMTNESLLVHMICDKCAEFSITASTGTVLPTTLDNVRDIQSYYTFRLKDTGKNRFTVEPEIEMVRHNTNGRFYHLGVDLQTKIGHCTIGFCDKNRKVDEIFRSLIILKVPLFNIDKIQNVDQYLDKMKLYSLFS